MAKIDHIRQCFNIDKRKRFQALRRIREVYLHLKTHSRLKMKVCVAARTLSHTVASTLEEMVSNPNNNIPSQAIETAEFVHDVDQLFDSFNGRTTKPECGKPYRRCMSNRSAHAVLWNRLLPKINSWMFIDEKVKKKVMPFKSGWLTTIAATKELWNICKDLGFKFLRTRALNQDPLENSFASIRHLGAENVNPSCYQFISSFKTSVLNNLITPSSNKNCETDDGSILDNLQDFLESSITKNDFIDLDVLDVNEIENLALPLPDTDVTGHEGNTLAYVAGFIIKNLKSIKECEVCAANIISDCLEPHHTFTMFKEYSDNKLSLNYVTKNFLVDLAKMYDIVIAVLVINGHINHLVKKIKILIKKYVTLEWFTCNQHLDYVFNYCLDVSVSLIIKKYYDDVYRSSQDLQKNDLRKKKINTNKKINNPSLRRNLSCRAKSDNNNDQ
ncbi:uncharacterized protein LOC126881182 [Diabrotica virgifera virgifera]|uniref:Transposable element P transposase n=1 Tax=Diabrotica virgifera virgifera TaxID=50390 RepID=A0ABM5JTG1_DIAVI|nr:uncharacterized protein LOC126881182 [Diabrotica virgifera virgifera]